MQTYIWQRKKWPHFTWDEQSILPLLSIARLKQGKLIQKVHSLLANDLTRVEAIVLEEETLQTARIEGEKYNPESVRSSIHRRLGLDYAGLPKVEQHIDGLIDVLLDATAHSKSALTVARLQKWQAALFPTGYSGLNKIAAGKFRTDSTGPMQVVSGAIGREKVHFQAPSATVIIQEIKQFLSWWQQSRKVTDGLIRAGVAHFYFITLHPFDDGNGRISRALADMALAQDDGLTKRYYSLSKEILAEKKAYYNVLEQSQKGGLDITNWLVWFLQCFINALDTSEKLLKSIFFKAEFWRQHQQAILTQRQRKVLNVLLDAGRGNFIGGLTTRKYVALTKVSRITAVREINDLLEQKLLTRNQALGRNVSYDLNWKL